MKIRLLAIFAILMLFGAPAVMAKNPKIAVVHIQKAINESEEGARSRAYFEKKAKSSQKKFQKQGKAIQEQEQALRSNMMLAESARAKEMQSINKQKGQLRQELKKAQQEFKQDEMRHLQRISQDLVLVVKKIGEKRKFDMVIEATVRQALLYTTFEITDITSEVVKEYNKMKSGKK